MFFLLYQFANWIKKITNCNNLWRRIKIRCNGIMYNLWVWTVFHFDNLSFVVGFAPFYKIYLGLFGKDYIDLRIRSKFSSLKGPGKGLGGNEYLGDTILKQSFETRFIYDLSSFLSINPYRIYIIFFSIDVERIRYLTVQI